MISSPAIAIIGCRILSPGAADSFKLSIVFVTRPAYSQLGEWYQVVLKSFGSLCEIMVSPLAFYFDHLEKENCSCLNFLRFNLSNFNNNGKCYYINGSRRSRKTALAVINKEKKM